MYDNPAQEIEARKPVLLTLLVLRLLLKLEAGCWSQHAALPGAQSRAATLVVAKAAGWPDLRPSSSRSGKREPRA